MYLRRVKELREDSDTPQKVIAEYLGVKQNTYSDYENGKIKIPLEVFFKLADYYKVSLVLLCKQAAKIFQTICKKETALKRVLRNLLSAISFAQI